MLSCVLWLGGDVGQDVPFLGGMLGGWGRRARGSGHRLEFFPVVYEPWSGLSLTYKGAYILRIRRTGCCGTLYCKMNPDRTGVVDPEPAPAGDQLEAVYLYLQVYYAVSS